MSTATQSSGGGIGCGGALTLLFIALKLTGHIDWSWWWVLSPVWIVAMLFIVAMPAVAIGRLLAAVWTKK